MIILYFVIIALVLIILILGIYFFCFSPKSQVLGKVIYQGNNPKQKIIALTFDDGPNEPYTSQILEILKQYKIKATFFPVGENIARDKITLKKMVSDGHEIGNHSYSHAFFGPILSPDFKREITKSQDLITNITGKAPTLFRPPWFFRNSSMLKTAKKMGMVTITGFFASYREVFQVNPRKIAADAINNTHPGKILVFHDGYNNKKASRSKTVEALKIFIPKLLKSGYRFVTVTELLSF